MLAKPNVIMNDIRLRGLAVGGVPQTGWTGNRLPTSQRPLPMQSKSFTGSSGHSPTQMRDDIYGLLPLVVFAPLIVLADSIALAEHNLAFGNGYTMWMDTVVGLVTLALPVLVFCNDAGRQPRLIGDHDRMNWAMGMPS